MTACSLARPPETGVFIDPALAPLIPADTSTIVGVRVETLSKTPLFKKLAGFQMIGGFARQAGVDADTRLWQVLMVSNGRRTLLLGKGKFTNGIIAPELARGNAARFSYHGLNLFGDEQEAVLFVNSSTAVWGGTPVLRDIADQKLGGSGPPAALAALLKEIPRETQIWGVYSGGTLNLNLAGNLRNLNKLISMTRGGSFYFDASNGLAGVATGIAANPQDAQQLRDALTGLIGLGRAMAPKNQPEIARAFNGLQVEPAGPSVRVRITEPEDVAEKLAALFVKP